MGRKPALNSNVPREVEHTMVALFCAAFLSIGRNAGTIYEVITRSLKVFYEQHSVWY